LNRLKHTTIYYDVSKYCGDITDIGTRFLAYWEILKRGPHMKKKSKKGRITEIRRGAHQEMPGFPVGLSAHAIGSRTMCNINVNTSLIIIIISITEQLQGDRPVFASPTKTRDFDVMCRPVIVNLTGRRYS
jgi:hypothetical protein